MVVTIHKRKKQLLQIQNIFVIYSTEIFLSSFINILFVFSSLMGEKNHRCLQSFQRFFFRFFFCTKYNVGKRDGRKICCDNIQILDSVIIFFELLMVQMASTQFQSKKLYSFMKELCPVCLHLFFLSLDCLSKFMVEPGHYGHKVFVAWILFSLRFNELHGIQSFTIAIHFDGSFRYVLASLQEGVPVYRSVSSFLHTLIYNVVPLTNHHRSFLRGCVRLSVCPSGV